MRCIFIDSNILQSKIYELHQCLGALVKALMDYNSEFKIESMKTKRRCRRVNI
jgi:hypothetical protein